MRISTSIHVILALLLTGCVHTELRVDNQTGTGIYVYSGHTKQITAIPLGATAAVPHSSGRIIVLTQRDDVWEYDDVTSVVDEATHGFLRVSLHVDITPDGSIRLPSGTKLTPSQILSSH